MSLLMLNLPQDSQLTEVTVQPSQKHCSLMPAGKVVLLNVGQNELARMAGLPGSSCIAWPHLLNKQDTDLH